MVGYSTGTFFILKTFGQFYIFSTVFLFFSFSFFGFSLQAKGIGRLEMVENTAVGPVGSDL